MLVCKALDVTCISLLAVLKEMHIKLMKAETVDNRLEKELDNKLKFNNYVHLPSMNKMFQYNLMDV